ncbi:MAG: tetratricopeptide repeat protein [Bryobacteraceae bacterium]
MKRNFILVAAAAALAVFSTGCQKLKARDNLNKGVQAFKGARYADAEKLFQSAVELDPAWSIAHLYLATAYVNQYIPGAESPENQQKADAAFKAFQRVLELEPANEVALASIASLYYNQKKLDEATVWNKKLIQVNPQAKEAYYTLAVIAWQQWLGPNREARIKMGMKVEDPGPLKDKKVREELRAKYIPLLDEGIQHTQKALDIDKEYDDAMAYMNLLIRYRADLLDTPEEYKKETERADEWITKALATKKMKAERQPVQGGITPP